MNPQIMVTDQDRERLNALLDSLDDGAIELLEEELSRAQIVPQNSMPDNVVTMNSVVTYVDELTGQAMHVALVYPHLADASLGRISILAPIGAALLGLREGQSIECPLPGGRTRRIRVKKVAFQPEALGAFDL